MRAFCFICMILCFIYFLRQEHSGLYNNAVTSVRTNDGNTDYFLIRIGFHQGSALSPYLFALVMDEVTRDIQGNIPWCMLFADDVVLVDESQAGVNRKLELWCQTL
jgi:hypothetical protein